MSVRAHPTLLTSAPSAPHHSSKTPIPSPHTPNSPRDRPSRETRVTNSAASSVLRDPPAKTPPRTVCAGAYKPSAACLHRPSAPPPQSCRFRDRPSFPVPLPPARSPTLVRKGSAPRHAGAKQSPPAQLSSATVPASGCVGTAFWGGPLSRGRRSPDRLHPVSLLRVLPLRSRCLIEPNLPLEHTKSLFPAVQRPFSALTRRLL